MTPVWKATIAAGAAALVGVWAITWSYADLAVYFAGDTRRAWESESGVAAVAEQDAARVRLERAYRLNPMDADYALALGRIHEAKALRYPVGDDIAQSERARAAEYYRQALALRPGWGFAWASLARAKMHDPDLDDEFYTALDRATIFGPWEPRVQDTVAWIGMTVWRKLEESQRERVRLTVRRVLDHYPRDRYVMQMAVRLYWDDELAPLLKTDEQTRWLLATLAQGERP